MPVMIWNDAFLTGIEQFDNDHKHLVELLNRTYDEYSHDPAAGDVEGIIRDLADYAANHFEAEERWLKEISYPKLLQQIDEHQKFAERVASFKGELLSGQATSSALFFFLAEWLTTHILESDADYGRYYATRS